MANATGGTVTTSGGKTIHTFTTSGDFVVPYAGSVDVLVVAGGGGGASFNEHSYYKAGGGGGGAGEFKETSTVSVSQQTYSVVIGNGGGTQNNVWNGTYYVCQGVDGDDSSALGISCNGGGGGGNWSGDGVTYNFQNNGRDGGSGGGNHGHTSNPGVGYGGSSVKTAAGDGNKGGDCAGYVGPSAGGGGAGAAGGDITTGTASSAGGVGKVSSISGSSAYYAGGGGGGAYSQANVTGGAGGTGGGGGYNTSATANTGGGGGGGSMGASTGGSGGSGVVIISYTTNSFIAAPAVTTGSATDIAIKTATLAGNVTSASGGTISERGVCWGLSENPTTSSSKATAAGTTGAYTVSATGLSAVKTYHYRAYAINEHSTAYGSDQTFTTEMNIGGAFLFNFI